MDIVIANCNSVDLGKLAIEPGRLNIKYGPNGTGKSTVAKAIELTCLNKSDLSSLKPFKHRDKPVDSKQYLPMVSGLEDVTSVAVFNEEYLSQFVFRPDEILKDSFEVFIRNADYDSKMQEIENLVGEIRQTFKDSQDIDAFLKDLGELSESFGKSQGGYSKAGRIAKGLGNGNKLDNVPTQLAPYTSFIQSDSNISWIKWQVQGNDFLKLSPACPYCTTSTEGKQETILAVAKEYDAKALEHLVGLKNTIGKLSAYFDEQTLETISKIVATPTGLKQEEITYLVGIKKQVDVLRDKVLNAKDATFFSLKDVEKVQGHFEEMKINLPTLNHLNSPKTQEVVDKINGCLDSVLNKAGALQGEINKQKKGIEATISSHKKEINDFLKFAGYRYSVDIQLDGTSYKMKLRHHDFNGVVDNGQAHLSYGERNAFSLVLFMYECLRKNPSLIILDDPISSFDKNKKFAILEKLFRGKHSLQGRTTLMLTHDIEPLIDLVKCLSHTFNPTPVAYFLRCRNGELMETQVTKSDIQTFAQICSSNIDGPGDDILKLIYLRRLYEISDDKTMAYELLSNLLHKRDTANLMDNGVLRDMTAAEVSAATQTIRLRMPAFDYQQQLASLKDAAKLKSLYSSTTNGYEKLQIFRVAEPGAEIDDVVRKFINETYHIENEYVMQLNPRKFDHIPEYITRECDHYIGVGAAPAQPLN